MAIPEASPRLGTSAAPRVNSGWLVVMAAYFGAIVSFGSLLVFTFGIFLKPK